MISGVIHRSLRGAASTEAAPPRGGLGRYLGGRLRRWQRGVVAGVGLALLPVMFVPVLPVWKMHLVAPQYREGLDMWIHVNTVRGDLAKINILNHYVGMKAITPESFPEFGYMPWVISLFGGVALLAALVGRRSLAFLGWAGFSLFGTIMMIHFAQWLQDYGTNLDPKAALQLGAFTPPLLGVAKRGNFVIQSFPAIGGVILVVAGLLGPLLVLSDLLARRRSAGPALLLVGLAGLAAPAGAVEFKAYAPAPETSPLQALVDAAASGSTLRLPDGVHHGRLVVTRPLILEGSPQAVLEGDGRGDVLIVRAPGTVLRGFTVRGSGSQLLLDEAGILVDEADDVTLVGLTLRDNNHGIYIKNTLRTRITDCTIEGRKGTVSEENHGNGIHVWYAKDAVIEGNHISKHRDGIYLSFAEAASVCGNTACDADRFGLHSMYSQRIDIERNRFTRNTAGVALMFSNRMAMTGNAFVENHGHRTYGLLLRDCSDSEFRHNRLVDNTIGLFLDGSNRNRFAENLVAENGWGVIAYASSEANVFTRNTFLENDYPVALDMRRTKNRLDLDGVGNYWSEARPYDLDGDGRGDAPYSPIGLFAFVSKQHPDLTVFAGSPAVVALDIAQRTLPALQPSELADPHPLLEPVPVPSEIAAPPLGTKASPRPNAAALGVAGLMAALSGAAVLFRSR
jgi:nitrous oxidase accessory protein